MLTYREALLTIFQRADFERGDRPPYSERVYRLSRVEELLQQLGDPHRAYPSVHIAGTKGKGSVTAMVDAILRAAGLRTGMYTSPHLHTFRERIRLDGEPIPEEDVARLVERMQPILDARPEVTVFEIMTALAMWYYAQERIEYGVFEVGMGGRLDATNVLRPMVSVITSISKDHTKVLGDTIEAIAREKAGIIKHGVPVVSAPQRPEALGVIEETSGEREAPLTLVTRDWHWRLLGSDLDGQRLTVYRRGHEARPEYPELHIPLLGTHQLENACVAVAAVESLREQGVSVTREAVARGLARVLWPGRMELLGRVPLVMVDGAHNPYSMRQLLASARRYLPYRRLHAIFGAGYTHVPDELLAILLPKADCLYVTQAHHPKAAPPAELQAMVSALGSEAHPCAHVGEALSQAMDVAAEDDLILVTGSLFIVAEARSAWAAMEGLPPYPSDPPGVY